MPIRFKKQTAASVTTPPTNYVTMFVDSTSGLPRLKTESGSLVDFVGGAPALTVSSVATSAVTAAISSVQRVDVSSGSVTVNLPAGHQAGDSIYVKLVSVATNSCTIDPAGTETIDGSLTLVLSVNYEWVLLISDGTNWMQLG